LPLTFPTLYFILHILSLISPSFLPLSIYPPPLSHSNPPLYRCHVAGTYSASCTPRVRLPKLLTPTFPTFALPPPSNLPLPLPPSPPPPRLYSLLWPASPLILQTELTLHIHAYFSGHPPYCHQLGPVSLPLPVRPSFLSSATTFYLGCLVLLPSGLPLSLSLIFPGLPLISLLTLSSLYSFPSMCLPLLSSLLFLSSLP
jgi:hypothetical protein